MNEATIAQIGAGVPERGWAGWFAVSAGIILGLTGLAKVYGAGGDEGNERSFPAWTRPFLDLL
jgi:hypothetical protein